MGWFFGVELSLLVSYVTCNDISVIYVTAHRCAGGLKKLYLRSGSQRHRHFVGFFNVSVLHRQGTILFIGWFRHTAPISRLLRHAGDTEDWVRLFLSRISDYGYITAPLKSPFTTRWGYGGRILDLNPRRPHGGGGYGRSILDLNPPASS